MIRILLIAAALLTGAGAAAQTPPTLSHQGYLTTSTGVPVNASVDMQFSLYTQSSGGAPLWSESQTVPVANGVYSVLLGSTEPLPDEVVPPLFLGVKIGTDAEMVPRQVIAPVPFALFADRARCNPGDIVGCSGAPGQLNIGVCAAGKRVCNPEGTAYGPCVGQQDPTTELCDQLDNDCDGMVDETFPDKGGPCTVGVGACQATGIRVCSVDGTATVCIVNPGVPGVEVCNGIDDDCDGAVDNNAPCGTLAHAQSTACVSGGCVVVSCDAGWLNCDGNNANGCEVQGNICVSSATIYQLKQGTVPDGTVVQVSNGVVSGVKPGQGFFMQVPREDPGYQGAQHSGIFVFSTTASVAIGNSVTVTGTVGSFNGQIQLGSASAVVSGSAILPAPEIVTPGAVATGGVSAGPLNAVLVRVVSVSVSAVDGTFNEFTLAGGLVVDDYLYAISPQPLVDDTFTTITGVLATHFNVSKLLPRSAVDVMSP